MKQKITLMVIGGIIFSYLFYNQTLGLNAIFFGIAIILFMIICNPNFYKNKLNFIPIIGTLVSSFFVYWYQTKISNIAFIISILMLFSIKESNNYSVFNNIITVFFNLICSPILFVVHTIENVLKKKNIDIDDTKTNNFKNIFYYLLVAFIIILFFIFYQNSNPLFYQYTKNLSFDISFGAIVFFVLGNLFFFTYLFKTKITAFFDIESKQNKNISDTQNNTEKHPIQVILVLFFALNAMLGFINFLDINYLYLSHQLPKGITNSKFVHNGVGVLIASILLGTSIICIIFKDKINFIKENKAIKILVYLWIAQNIFMVISTILRNNIYVENYGITGKRIGVYFYLIFTIIGLLTVAFKIFKQKSVYFLYYYNTWIWYVVLIICSTFYWENYIFSYNLKRFEKTKKIDYDYAETFSKSNLPEIVTLFKIDKFRNNNDSLFTKKDYKYNNYADYQTNLVTNSLTYFIRDNFHKKQWQSTNHKDEMMMQKIKKMNEEKLFKYVDFKDFYDYEEMNDLENNNKDSLNLFDKYLQTFTNINEIRINNNTFFRDKNSLQNIEIIHIIAYSDKNLENIQKSNHPKLKQIIFEDMYPSNILQYQKMFPNVELIALQPEPKKRKK